MHKRKIDMSDAIYVINRDDYIGASTFSEIVYAIGHKKEIYFMEDTSFSIIQKFGGENMERHKLDKQVKRQFVLKRTKCECCGKEFRFEPMYKFTEIGHWKSIWNRYGCKNCFSSKEDFYDFITVPLQTADSTHVMSGKVAYTCDASNITGTLSLEHLAQYVNAQYIADDSANKPINPEYSCDPVIYDIENAKFTRLSEVTKDGDVE